MEEYASNSFKSKENDIKKPEEKVKKVVSGNVSIRKSNPIIGRISEIFVPSDVENVKDYIIETKVIPSVKSMLLDIVTMFLDDGSVRHRYSSPGSKISYQRYYEKPNERRPYSNDRKTVYQVDEITISDRGEAEQVLDSMRDYIDRYDAIPVAAYYDLVGVTNTDYTCNNFGWLDLSDARVKRNRYGFYIDLPRPVALG